MPLHERRRHGRDMAGRILIVDDERVMLTGKIRLYTVDGADTDASAADALGHDIERAAVCSRELQAHGVRVRIAHLHVLKCERQPLLRRDGEAFRDAQVVRLHAEQARNQRAVRAVAVAGQGKAAVQRDVGMHRPVAEQLARRQANAHSAGRVTAGRADHHGPENIK